MSLWYLFVCQVEIPAYVLHYRSTYLHASLYVLAILSGIIIIVGLFFICKMLEILALEIDMAPTKTEYGMTLDPTQARAICSLQDGV